MKTKSRFLSRAAAVACAVFVGAMPIAAQEAPADTTEIDEELQNAFAGDAGSANSALQRNFIMLAAQHLYDFNPHTANYTTEAQLLTALYEGLFSYDPRTLDPVPALAETYKLSRNKKRWTFTLREGTRFSDGSAITAESVRSSWLRLLAAKNAPYASLLDCIEGAEAFRNGNADASDVGITVRDERTLVVALAVPTAHLPRILCHHAFSVLPPLANDALPAVYSGAFTLAKVTDAEITLVKNEQYWDAANVALPSITVALSDDMTENSFRFNAGNADWIMNMVDTKVLLNPQAIRIAAEFGTEYLFFTAKNAPWNNVDFRNALVSAVPWDELRKGVLVRASTLVYPLSGYPAVEGLDDTSLDDALDMIADARKAAGISANEKLRIVFGISATSERQKTLAEVLKTAWEPLGVELVVQTTSDDRYLNSIPYWNADLFSYSWIGDFADPTAFLELFRAGSTLNQTKWRNERFEQLLREASETTDTSEHYKLLSRAEQVLLDDGVILPIAHQVSLHAVNPNTVGGWYTNALDIHPFKYLYLKEDTTTVPNVVQAADTATLTLAR